MCSTALMKSFSRFAAIDEVDNRPKHHYTVLYPSKVNMSIELRSEVMRLKTFDNWPLSYIDSNILAMTGMFYTKMEDKVKCYFCGVEIGRWDLTDDPVTEHTKWSGNCPLLRRRVTDNIPINPSQLDRVLPPISYDVCGANDIIEIRRDAYPEGTITNSIQVPPSPASTNYQIGFPEYAIEAARRRSFAEWPRGMKQLPKDLAEAGFFYTGIGDRVKCFSCGGGLKDWDAHDDPWEQHALWLNKCKYLKLMKGEEYVENILARHNEKTEKSEGSQLEARESSTQTSEEEHQQPENNEQCSNSVPSACATAEPAKTAYALEKDTLVRKTKSNCEKSNPEEKNIPREKLCKICYADEYSTAFLPCGHVVACAMCASSVTKCPMCRQPFQDVMRVYFS